MNAQLLAAIQKRKKFIGDESEPQPKPNTQPKTQNIPQGNKQNFSEAKKLLQANLFKPAVQQIKPTQPKQQLKGNHENMMNAKKLLQAKLNFRGEPPANNNNNNSNGFNLPTLPPPPSLNNLILPPLPTLPSLDGLLPPPLPIGSSGLLPPPKLDIGKLLPPPPLFEPIPQNKPIINDYKPPVIKELKPPSIIPPSIMPPSIIPPSIMPPSITPPIINQYTPPINQQNQHQQFNQQPQQSNQQLNQNITFNQQPIKQIISNVSQQIPKKTNQSEIKKVQEKSYLTQDTNQNIKKKKNKIFVEEQVSSKFFNKDIAGFIKKQFLKNNDMFQYIGQKVPRTQTGFNFPSIQKGIRQIQPRQTLYVDTKSLNLSGSFLVNNLNCLRDHNQTRELFLQKLKSYDYSKDAQKLRPLKQMVQSIPQINYQQLNIAKINHTFNRCDALLEKKSRARQYQECTVINRIKDDLTKLVERYCKNPEDQPDNYQKIEKMINQIKDLDQIA